VAERWSGLTVMTWYWVGFSFFLFACSNLIPRAYANHDWYLERIIPRREKQRSSLHLITDRIGWKEESEGDMIVVLI